jgi:hypothetical protein
MNESPTIHKRVYRHLHLKRQTIRDNYNFGNIVNKSKIEWLHTFQLLIEYYHRPKRNKNSQRVRIFLTDFAAEIHEHEFSEYISREERIQAE